MKKLFLIVSVLCLFAGRAAADEGMWLLPLIEKLNIKDMKAEGLKLSAEDLYNVNGNSLKDAIVIFGGGCTGEVVSPDGLLLTNHHCGYSAIQGLSSVEHDYLKHGFWAQDRTQEIPAPGLSVTFVRHIEEVTEQIIQGVDDNDTEPQRRTKVTKNRDRLIEKLRHDYPGKSLNVGSFFGGNQYFLFVMEIYHDVRLVGAPPQSIGKYGGETDNWIWPRHTGDFSVFRIYAAPDGTSPAVYSADNVPYKAPVHLKISLKGYGQDDYSMVMGFPGRTQRFMTSFEIDQMVNRTNPNRIAIREARQAVLKRFMAESDEIRIKYSDKWATSSNYWKNAIGMNNGIRKLGVKEEKQTLEKRFAAWAVKHPKYRDALSLIEQAVAERTEPASKLQIINETVMGIEIIGAATRFSPMIKKDIMPYGADEFYKDYDEAVDRECAREMLAILLDSVPEALPAQLEPWRDNIPGLVEHIYNGSVFANRDKLEAYLDDPAKLDNDPAVQFAARINSLRTELNKPLTSADIKFVRGHRLLIAGLQEMEPSKNFYPDANSTLRLTYGSVQPYSPADGVLYDYRTFLRGVMEKEDPLNPTEFYVPERLKELYDTRDFGPYAIDGNVPVCFITNNDITGGNSGSPVMNARGELTGIAFDSNWEGVAGDVAFNPELQRTIAVDIRYVLFIIDKFAGAKHLINEMSIVR